MNLSLETLRGYRLDARDGEIGRIRDYLFDDHQWGGRWLVADTGKWLLGKKVLLSPISFEDPDHDGKTIAVNLTKEEVENSPHLDEDAPVSRQFEKTFFDHYHWPYYWLGGGLWANTTHPMYLDPTRNPLEKELEPEDPEQGEHVLRSGHELTKYTLLSHGDGIGYVEDLIVDTSTWAARFLVMDTRKWFKGKKILIPPEQVTKVSWNEHAVHVDVPRGELEEAPAYEEDAPVDDRVESRVRGYFGLRRHPEAGEK